MSSFANTTTFPGGSLAILALDKWTLKQTKPLSIIAKSDCSPKSEVFNIIDETEASLRSTVRRFPQ